MTDEKIQDLEVDAPPEYLCPITMCLMKDPVIMPDGQTYEREAIQKALEANPVSPLTRQPMDMKDAKTNYALKSLIDKYIQEHIHEVEDNDKPIDPSNIVSASNPANEIPVTHINELQLESFTAQYKDDLMLISVKPQAIEGRLPVSIIAMIDVSGSMDCDASLPLPGTEDTSLTRLQLVQYSLKTVISVLGSEDRITLITFSDSASVELENVLLTAEGKEKASKIIDSFRPSGCTNIWDALDKGIDQAIKEKAIIEQYNQKDSNYQINTSLLLFTDGEPNQNPPMGIIPCLEDKLSDIKVHFSISSFAFGYQIDSELMEDIAQIGNGIYGYCPDATMVGTILISYMSSIISMTTPLSTLDVNFNKGTQTKNTLSLYNGATAHFMIKLGKNDNPNDVQINLNLPLTNQHFLVSEIKETDEETEMNFRDQKYRKLLIDLILNCKKNNLNCDESIQKVKDLFEEIRQLPDRTQFLNNLMIDLYNDDDKHGQIERAYRHDYFNKWGKNYLFSLVRFHIVEQCGNFKDMSLQLYGNETFKKFRKTANKIFMNLPIPEKRASRQRFNRGYNSPSSSRVGMPQQCNRSRTMRSYNTRSNVCFNGDALIKLADGKEKKVNQLVKGDQLENGAKVLCLVKTATENGQSDAVKIGDALFTPYHPVKVNVKGQKEKVWVFPVDVGNPELVKIDFWYNIVLDNCENSKNNNGKKSQATAIVGGVETVTLGHGINEGVCKHPYFGTEKVISALMKHGEFEKGLIEFKKMPDAKRDPITDMVIECF